LISALVALGLSYAMHPFRPRPSFAAAAEIFTFSRWLFLNNLAYFIRFRGMDLIIGKLTGASGLGLFSIAYQIASLPTSDFVGLGGGWETEDPRVAGIGERGDPDTGAHPADVPLRAGRRSMGASRGNRRLSAVHVRYCGAAPGAPGGGHQADLPSPGRRYRPDVPRCPVSSRAS
jgi:hypothetical protein